MRSRANRSVAAICIAVIALAAFLPGIAALAEACSEPAWIFLPDATPAAFVAPSCPASAQPLPLLAGLASRGPPSLPRS